MDVCLTWKCEIEWAASSVHPAPDREIYRFISEIRSTNHLFIRPWLQKHIPVTLMVHLSSRCSYYIVKPTPHKDSVTSLQCCWCTTLHCDAWMSHCPHPLQSTSFKVTSAGVLLQKVPFFFLFFLQSSVGFVLKSARVLKPKTYYFPFCKAGYK